MKYGYQKTCPCLTATWHTTDIHLITCLGDEEAVEDQIFGVPLFVFNGEQFWGHDRIWLLEHVLKEAGLEK